MTNRELQDLLKQYPDDLPVCMIDNERSDAIDYVERRTGAAVKSLENEYFSEAIVLF